jgi:hypothetical protein
MSAYECSLPGVLLPRRCHEDRPLSRGIWLDTIKAPGINWPFTTWFQHAGSRPGGLGS